MSTGKKQRTVVVGRFGPVTGPLNAAAGAFAVASLGHVLALPAWWAAVCAAAAGLLHEAEAARRGLPRFTQAHRAVMWGGYGWWTWYALTHGPYQVHLVAGLVLGTGVAIVSSQAAHVYAQTLTERDAEEQRILRRRGKADEWVRRIHRVCRIDGVTVEALEDWERPDPASPGRTRKTGYSLQVRLPAGGHRWVDIKSKTLELAADADLPEGCGVEVRRGSTQQRAIIDVTTLDIFAEDVELPHDFTPKTAADPIDLGVRADGSIAQVTLRWMCGLLIGQTGSGKSNMLTVVMCQLLRRTDVVIMGIDPNGGKAFKPFLRPWIRAGRTGKPPLAWVAPDGAEGDDEHAWALVTFLKDAIPIRSRAYDHLMEDANDDKIPTSPQVPQILLITDETANLSRRVKGALTELSNRSRAASIRQLTCALRAIDKGGDGIPTDVLAMAKVRIAMDVDDDQELNYLFGWNSRAPKAEESKGVGTGWAMTGKETARQHKAYRARPSDAAEFAQATERLRPELDEVTIGADPQAWGRRWAWLDTGDAPKPASEQPRQQAPQPGASVGPDPAEAWKALGLPDFDQARHTQQPGGVDVEEEFRRITTEALADVGRAGPEGRVPWLLVRCHQVCDGPRVHIRTLADACGLTSRRVADLLRMVEVEPIPHPVEVGGQKQKGYESAHITLAMAQVGQGLVECPAEVWDAVGPPD